MKSRNDSAWLETELRRALAARRPSPDFAWRTAMRSRAAAPAEPSGENLPPTHEPIGTFSWFSRGWRAGFSLAAGLLIALALGLSLRLHPPTAPATPMPASAQARQIQAQVEFALQFTRVRLRRIVLHALPGLRAKVSQRGETL